LTKKKALGVDPLSWIKPTVNTDTHEPQPKNEGSVETKEEWPPQHVNASSLQNPGETSLPQTPKEDKSIPKFQTYEIKLTVRLKEDQLEFLSRLEREIMKNRSSDNRKERITKNSVIRAMVDTFRNLDIDTREIGDEEELVKRLIRAVSLKGRGNIAI
jgi:hypothetical protein